MRFVSICLVSVLAGCAAPPPTLLNNAPIADIAGMVAGAPQRCAGTTQSEGLRAANRNTLLLRRGRSVWVNQLQDGCGGFGQWDVIVTEPIGTQHCEGDLVRSFDPVTKIPGPACRLGAFIPYTRP
jgi:hypothetical protein